LIGILLQDKRIGNKEQGIRIRIRMRIRIRIRTGKVIG